MLWTKPRNEGIIKFKKLSLRDFWKLVSVWVQFPRKVLLQEFYITKTSSSEVIFKSFSITFEETKCENASRMITIDNLSFKLHYVLSLMLQLHLWYKRIVPAVVSGNPICEIFSSLFALNELYGKDFPLPSTPCRVTRILSTHKWEYEGELLCRFSPWTTFFWNSYAFHSREKLFQ